MVRCERLASGDLKRIAVANFSARIVRNLVLDDDGTEHRNFAVETKVAGQERTVIVSAAEFNRMSWVLNRLGPQAIIYPGQQQHARVAIQSLSGSVQQQRIYTQLGWKKHGTEWIYLQTGGAMGARGPQSEVQVQLPAALTDYRVVAPASAKERAEAVRASLRFLSLAADRITFPLLAGVYRAALGKVDFSLFLTGPSGTFKTALAALCQQHFGASMDASRLPASFASTANALEELAFRAKDALLVVDDFVPTGGTGDGALHGLAERLFRSAGNRQGRSRTNGHGRLDAPRPPRALLLATGEEVPRGHSLRARLLMVDVGPGDVHRGHLTTCQCAGNRGQLAAALGGFIGWVASRYDNLREQFSERIFELRSQRLPTGIHARVPTAIAELQAGWEIWLQFALEVGAIGKAEKRELEHRSRIALSELAARQSHYQQDRDPAVGRSHKKANVIAMMKRAKGATLTDILEVTGWQRHTVWGFVSILRSKGGLKIESSKNAAGEHTYRIVSEHRPFRTKRPSVPSQGARAVG
jgi:hypothetical protein